MTPDPVLEGLITAGAFAIAADRYEEETGDTELAALMRIPGLEWQLVDGKPGLKLAATLIDAERWAWWETACGRYDFGHVCLAHKVEPPPMPRTPLTTLLQNVGLGNDLAPRLYQLYREAVKRACVL